MIEIPSFSKFENSLYEREIVQSQIVQDLLEKLEPTIQRMIDRAKDSYFQQYEREMTDWDIEYTRVIIIWQLLRSIEIYTLPTDTLVNISSRGSANGTIVIDATIKRDGQLYALETDVIYAGGYNIQRLHFRYITKTNLSKQKTSEAAQAYAEKVKRMSKADKLNNDLINYEKRVENSTAKAEENKKKTDAEILDILRSDKEYGLFIDTTWETILKNGRGESYHHSEEEFNVNQKEYLTSQIDFWKTKNITWAEQDAREITKTVNKLKIKLAALSES